MAIGALLLCSGTAAAEPSTPSPFDGLGDNAAHAFTGTRLLWYAAAVGATAGMSPSGADHALRVDVQRHLAAPAYGDAAYYTGYIAPVVVAPGLYVVGLLADDRDTTGAGAAAIQALAMTVVITTTLKIVTGRPFPLHGGDPRAADRLDHPEYAREFNFFQPTRGLAWPSGHASASFSIAAALTAYRPDEPWIPAVAYPVAAGIGVGMVVGDHHWASDVIAGALLGQGIGWSVGQGFRRARGENKDTGLLVLPRQVPGGAVLAASGWF